MSNNNIPTINIDRFNYYRSQLGLDLIEADKLQPMELTISEETVEAIVADTTKQIITAVTMAVKEVIK